MNSEGEHAENLTVLLASQDDFFRDRVLDMLHKKEYPVVVVDSCYRAFEFLLDNDFDFVIFDPSMEALDGFDVLKLIKRVRPEVPLIVAADNSSYESGVKIAETGVYFRLPKPIDEKITKALIKTLQKKGKK